MDEKQMLLMAAKAGYMRLVLETAANDLSKRLSKIGGCTDGGCQVVMPKGMHTNGGCKCLSDHLTARRVVHAYKTFAKSVAAAIGEQSNG